MLAVNSSEKRPERATFLQQVYQELAVALVKGNAMCGWRGMQLVMGGASERAQLGAVPRGLAFILAPFGGSGAIHTHCCGGRLRPQGKP
jgi:hypothetical protein